jgi:hypothetical protein
MAGACFLKCFIHPFQPLIVGLGGRRQGQTEEIKSNIAGEVPLVRLKSVTNHKSQKVLSKEFAKRFQKRRP